MGWRRAVHEDAAGSLRGPLLPVAAPAGSNNVAAAPTVHGFHELAMAAELPAAAAAALEAELLELGAASVGEA